MSHVWLTGHSRSATAALGRGARRCFALGAVDHEGVKRLATLAETDAHAAHLRRQLPAQRALARGRGAAHGASRSTTRTTFET